MWERETPREKERGRYDHQRTSSNADKIKYFFFLRNHAQTDDDDCLL